AGAFLGNQYALQDTPVIGTFPNAAVAGGIVYCSSDIVNASGTDLGAGSTLHCGKLPKGAVPLYTRVTPLLGSSGVPTVLANAVIFNFGYTGDTNALGVTTTFASSAVPQAIAPIPDGTVDTGQAPLTSAKDIFATSSVAELVATEALKVEIYYTVAGKTV
ncbi:unnamed protein product, partial [marine sediment metagenome]